MTKELKSLKKISWIFTSILGIIVIVGGISIESLNWLPLEYQSTATGIIGACALISTIFMSNARTYRAEEITVQDIIDNLIVTCGGVELNTDKINIEENEENIEVQIGGGSCLN